MSELVQLTVDIGTLAPSGTAETRQQFAEALAERLLVYLPSANMTFRIGGSKPTSDEGPWFKEVTNSKTGNASYELWVWSDTAADYVALAINQAQLRYFVGQTEPSSSVYDVWVKTSSSGAPLGLFTYDTADAAWEPVSYLPSEVDAFFEGETGGGKKQVDWASLLNVPGSALAEPRSVSGALGIGDAEYDWEQVYHTDAGQMVVYDPINTVWKTLSGGVGDIKFVSGGTLGSTGDFAAGTFSTVLGKNPGWQLDTAAQGRVIVAADDSEVWDATTVLTKNPGSTYGADTLYLTEGQLPPHIHPMDKYLSLNYSSTQGTNIEGAPGTEQGLLDTGSTGDGDPISLQQKAIAYYCLRKIL